MRRGGRYAKGYKRRKEKGGGEEEGEEGEEGKIGEVEKRRKEEEMEDTSRKEG